ncbi:ankyrin repeat domain-containing protein [Brachyspira intermedia]
MFNRKGSYVIKHSSALWYASKNGHIKIVRLLIDSGADINLKNIADVTVLILASMNNHLEIVKYLVENGADINVKDKKGRTALRYAVENGHSEVAEFLKSKVAK